MLNENMPNFNHRNPFVIVCSQTWSKLDDKILHLTKQWLIVAMINAGIAILSAIIIAFIGFGMNLSNMIYSIASLIGIGFMFFNLIYFCVLTTKFSGITNDPIRKNVDKLMKSQISEVANMNIEEVNKATIDMNFVLGKVSIAFQMINVGKWFGILTGLYYIFILVGYIFIK